MDKLTEHRNLVQRLLQEYERLYNLQPSPGVEAFVVFDDEQARRIGHRSLVHGGPRKVRKSLSFLGLIGLRGPVLEPGGASLYADVLRGPRHS